MNWHNFAPRVGVAYQIDPKTVVRAGYGWSYDLGVFGSNFGHNVTQNPPVLSNQSVQPPNGFTDVFTLARGLQPWRRSPWVQNGTFPLAGRHQSEVPACRRSRCPTCTVQRRDPAPVDQQDRRYGVVCRQLPTGTASWAPSTVLNPNEAIFVPGVANTNLDRPYYTKFGWTNDLSYYCNCSNEHYNSFQGTVQGQCLGRVDDAGQLHLSAAVGRWLGTLRSNYNFLYDRAAGQGYSSILPRQQWTFAQTYDIPYGHGRKYGAKSAKATGLRVGRMDNQRHHHLLQRVPIFSDAGELRLSGRAANRDRTTGPMLGSGDAYSGAQGNRSQWFVGGPSRNCTSGPYTFPAANTFGNYPINTLFGPHFIQQDLTLAKTFQITEKIALRLRTDARTCSTTRTSGRRTPTCRAPVPGRLPGSRQAA